MKIGFSGAIPHRIKVENTESDIFFEVVHLEVIYYSRNIDVYIVVFKYMLNMSHVYLHCQKIYFREP